ncbi:hypothetical protein [Nocardiopsis tropica]|uniref:Uncharacterized protein n=1 Tax=Nocardiopsis tropica TaxID=109330 RepID=A0ABV2A428_9ACTN|nr:hypothetical protein [Nocardiopsis tropica]
MATRFKREKPEQYGSADIAQMTPHEIVDAKHAGHLADMLAGSGPDAQVDHAPTCESPAVARLPRRGAVRQGDPVVYQCRSCDATKEA